MKISYIISEEDYLTYQLHSATTVKSIKTTRTVKWLLFSVVYIGVAAALYLFTRQDTMAYAIGGLGLLWLIAFPFYAKWIKKDQYKKHIKKSHSEMFGRIVNIDIEGTNLFISDDKNETTIPIKHLVGIIEIKLYYFVKMKTGGSIIIPKNRVDSNKNLVLIIQDLVKNNNVPFERNLKWKW